MANHRLYAFWNNLTVALRTGETQNETRNGGASFFRRHLYGPLILGKGFADF